MIGSSINSETTDEDGNLYSMYWFPKDKILKQAGTFQLGDPWRTVIADIARKRPKALVFVISILMSMTLGQSRTLDT